MATASAGPKIVGYIYQFQRALYRLFSSEHSSLRIGIETEDDVVAVTKMPDGSVEIVFEQDKHSLKSSGHPYQDGSTNLWHTLHIWLDEARKREDDGKIGFYLVTNKAVTAKAFARVLAEATSESEVDACVLDIRTRASKMTGEASFSASAVAAFTDEEIGFVVKNLSLLDEHGTASGAHPKQATIQLFHLTNDIADQGEEIYGALLGHLVDVCDQAWVHKTQVWIDKEPFAKRLSAEINKRRVRKFVEQPWMSIDLSDYLKNDTRDHLFLHQLYRFGAATKICNVAIGHFWGFYAERTRLMEEGNVLPDDWKARDAELHSRWQQKLVNMEGGDVGGTDQRTLALTLFRETLNGDYHANLGQYKSSHWYFTAGNYHALANNRETPHFIYWHTDFAPKLEEEL